MSFYLKEGQPRFALRGLDESFIEAKADQALPPPGARKTVTIRSGDRVLIKQDIDFVISPVVPETFDIGRDDGSAVVPDYPANVPLPGTLKNLTFKLQ